MKERIYGPELNDGKHIFVFGSNEAGRHGKGAAKIAKDHWRAITGIGFGPQGRAYAIPTKDSSLRTLPLAVISEYVEMFKRYAIRHPEFTFLVTRIGCGLAGYQDSDISPLFKNSTDNVSLPEGWKI